MDFISHALWGGITIGRKSRKFFLSAMGISLLPDLLTEGLFAMLYLAGIGDMPGWDAGHPDIIDYPIWAQYLYSGTHSLILFVPVFLILWGWAGKPVWLAGAWGLHILIDIPTHTLELFPTPFLWPLSDFKVDGIPWDQPTVIIIDMVLLLSVYSVWLIRSRLQKS